jgi:hypothetical protein
MDRITMEMDAGIGLTWNLVMLLGNLEVHDESILFVEVTAFVSRMMGTSSS